MSNVLITGAGVDKTPGIDFPLANKLLPEIARFIDGEGKEFSTALRKAIPNLQFNFTKFINSQIETITKKDVFQLKQIVELISKAIESIEDDEDTFKKRGKVIELLFNKLVKIRAASEIDEDTYNLINEAFGEEYTESDFVIDLHKMSLSDSFKLILKVTLKESLQSASNPISEAIGTHLLDIEQLLIDKFLGFYSNKQGDVKNYIYISWCLWAYLVWKQRQVITTTNNDSIPFYSSLPKNVNAITLNYTTFLADVGFDSDVTYFHGGLAEYVRMDTRQLLPIDNINELDLVKFVEKRIAPNIDFSPSDVAEQRHVIPSLVPPLKLKPILSHKYIETWASAAELIHSSTKVVVIGYSFNSADEHFNDIIRNGTARKYDIVAPDALSDAFMNRVKKVFGVSIDAFTDTEVQGIDAKTTTDIRLIAAKADEIDINKLFGD